MSPLPTMQVLTALSVLHARGIMHRNLTGQAVLLSRGGKAQVAILDLARERPRYGAPLSPWAFARAQIAPECLLSVVHETPSLEPCSSKLRGWLPPPP